MTEENNTDSFWSDLRSGLGQVSQGLEVIANLSEITGGLDSTIYRNMGNVFALSGALANQSADGVLTYEEAASATFGTAGAIASGYIVATLVGGPIGLAAALVVSGFAGATFTSGLLATFDTETPLIDFSTFTTPGSWPSQPWEEPTKSIGDFTGEFPSVSQRGLASAYKPSDAPPKHDGLTAVSLQGIEFSRKGGDIAFDKGGNQVDPKGWNGGDTKGWSGDPKGGDSGGNHGGLKGGDTGDNSGGSKGGHSGGINAGSKGNDPGGSNGGSKGGDSNGHNGGSKDNDSGGSNGGKKGNDSNGSNGGSKSNDSNGSNGVSKENDSRGYSEPNTGPRPVLLDLDGDGLKITELDASTVFVDADNDGLKQRTAWAAAGDGVLFYDADESGDISSTREYVFTEWDPTTTTDLDALRSVFDTNGDGKLTSADAGWADFKVMVTQADGSQLAQTLAQLNITEIDLTGDATQIELPDGSVITGTTTFTYANGSTGTVGELTLRASARGYDVEQVESVNGNGDRVQTTTAYAADGSIAFKLESTVSQSGSLTTNRYDDDGDGVVDRVQVISKSTNPDGSKVANQQIFEGANTSSGVLIEAHRVTVSADSTTETIDRDTRGGGWFDQTEVRVTNPDGSVSITVTDKGKNGSASRIVQEVVSANGMTRTESVDEDGNGTTDYTLIHAITINGNGSRTETTTRLNADGSTRDIRLETVSADGKTRSVETDIDGNGLLEALRSTSIAINSDGSTTSSIAVYNQDASLRTGETHTQSADALVTSVSRDIDGDGTTDQTTTESTVLNADGSRVDLTTVLNGDGSIRSMQSKALGSDSITSTTRQDLDQDGVFSVDEEVAKVSVNSTSGEKTAEFWSKNADGSVNSHTRTVTDESGLSSTTDLDLDGDGDWDVSISESTQLIGSGASIQTLETRNADGSLREHTTIERAGDGLSSTTFTDQDGDGSIDRQIVETTARMTAQGSIRTITEWNGVGDNRLSSIQIEEGYDRRLHVTRMDHDGDGVYEDTVQKLETTSGEFTSTSTYRNHDGSLSARFVESTSADGLNTAAETDANGDGIYERRITSYTTINADGSRTTAMEIRSSNNILLSSSLVEISDDRHTSTTKIDADGNGVFERESLLEKTYLSSGATRTVESSFTEDDTLYSRTETTVSDNGLVNTVRYDRDGDGVHDLVKTSTVSIHANGSTSTLEETRDANNALRSSSSTTISDNLRNAITTLDLNGDGAVDVTIAAMISDAGFRETVETWLGTDGSVQRVQRETQSADDLIRELQTDADGNGVFERVTREQSRYNADGSVTTTISLMAFATIYSEAIHTVSDDALRSSSLEDWNYDGAIDLETRQETILELDGSRRDSSIQFARDGSIIEDWQRAEAANGRSVIETRDWTGDGQVDWQQTRVEAANGDMIATTDFFQEGGSLASQIEITVSDDGLERTETRDFDGNGISDYTSTETELWSADGSTSITTMIFDASGTMRARELVTVSGDGLTTAVDLDLDGVGGNNYESERVVQFLSDGVVQTTSETRDANGTLLFSSQSTASANGLVRGDVGDLTGDGLANVTRSYVELGDGSLTDIVERYSGSNNLEERSVTTVSADGRTTETWSDLDGDGSNDLRIKLYEDFEATQFTLIGDYSGTSRESLVVAAVSANGHKELISIDIGGDDLNFIVTSEMLTGNYTSSVPEILLSTEIEYLSDGSAYTQIEKHYSSGRLGYRETKFESANGLLATTTYDIDGDGITDGTKTREVLLGADGSRETITTVELSEGSLHSRTIDWESANGRAAKTLMDFDGNGYWDKTVEWVISRNGEQVTTTKTFDRFGTEESESILTISTDRQTETFVRGSITEIMNYNPLENGSYTWTSGTTTNVVFDVDGLGVGYWSVTKNGQSSSIRLDIETKNKITEEAARLYDTLLDRDMFQEEIQTLVVHAEDNVMNWASLAEEILGSNEFSTRYGVMTDAEFIIQMFLNTYGRGPSLTEMSDALLTLQSPDTRVNLSRQLAESAEHLVTGNQHLSTNNFDLLLNPAQFERSLDEAYVEQLIFDLMDVAADRAPTSYELKYLSDLLMEGVLTVSDVANEIISVRNDIQGVAEALLFDITGTAFIDQAFKNAFGRLPTTAEQTAWDGFISNGDISRADFVAFLSMSLEHQADGNVSDSQITTPNYRTAPSQGGFVAGNFFQDHISGSNFADTLDGKAGSDVLIGGGGNDSLMGAAGGDRYIWSKGHGNDSIGDSSNSLLSTDILELSDVLKDDLQISQSGDHLLVSIISTGEVITVLKQFENGNFGKGVELIVLADGSEIVISHGNNATATYFGTEASETLIGWAENDELHGLDGNDTLNGMNGADTLFGGAGDDLLYGGAASDILWGGLGDDTLGGGGGADTLEGGDGFDQANYSGSNAGIVVNLSTGEASGGDAADDILRDIEAVYGSSYNDQITGDDQSNRIMGQAGSDTIFGGAGNDTLEGGLGNDSIRGEANRDEISGGEGDDTLKGDAGDDTLSGDGGNDQIYGGVGLDLLFGGEGNDSLDGGDHHDNVFGDAGNDTLIGGEGDDTLHGGVGFDSLRGGVGHDWQYGGDQADNLYGDAGNDTLFGDLGNDRLFGGLDNDSLRGGQGADMLNGEAGNDTLFGEAGNDRLYGGSGFDVLEGGSGNDELWGNSNWDTFVFSDGHGSDTIQDFEALNQFEKIDLSGISALSNFSNYSSFFSSGAVTSVASGVLLDTGGGNTILLSGISLSDLDNSDFIF